AIAQPMTQLFGTASGEYANLDLGAGTNLDTYLGKLGASIKLGSGFGVQGNFLFGTGDGGGNNVDVLGVGGAVTYRDIANMSSRFAAGVQYYNIDFAGFDVNNTDYGVGGEVYLSEMITFAARGGGFSASFNTDGFYLGGDVTFYPIPNLSARFNLDYANISPGGDIANYGGELEFIPFSTFPVSIFGGYDRTDLSGGGGDIDTWRIGLKAYIGTTGDPTLTSYQRHEPIRIGTLL
ncbi:MAG: hypothetical protein ACKVG0_02980, partial [Alphaproteobacteria bacterium]